MVGGSERKAVSTDIQQNITNTSWLMCINVFCDRTSQ